MGRWERGSAGSLDSDEPIIKVGGGCNNAGCQVTVWARQERLVSCHWLSSRPMSSSASSENRMLVLVCSLGNSLSGSRWDSCCGSPSSRKSSMLNSSSLISPRCEAGPLCSFWRSSISLISWYLIDSGLRVIFRSFLNFGMGLSRSSWCTEDLRDREARVLRALWMMSKVGSELPPSASSSINKIINPPARNFLLLSHPLAKDSLTTRPAPASLNFPAQVLYFDFIEESHLMQVLPTPISCTTGYLPSPSLTLRDSPPKIYNYGLNRGKERQIEINLEEMRLFKNHGFGLAEVRVSFGVTTGAKLGSAYSKQNDLALYFGHNLLRMASHSSPNYLYCLRTHPENQEAPFTAFSPKIFPPVFSFSHQRPQLILYLVWIMFGRECCPLECESKYSQTATYVNSMLANNKNIQMISINTLIIER